MKVFVFENAQVSRHLIFEKKLLIRRKDILYFDEQELLFFEKKQCSFFEKKMFFLEMVFRKSFFLNFQNFSDYKKHFQKKHILFFFFKEALFFSKKTKFLFIRVKKFFSPWEDGKSGHWYLFKGKVEIIRFWKRTV